MIVGELAKEYLGVINPLALELLSHLHRLFQAKRQNLLKRRIKIEKRISEGNLPTFLKKTKHIRDGSWIIGDNDQLKPNYNGTVDVVCWKTADERAFTDCLESDSNGIQFDFDDSFSPTWSNCLKSQLNLWHWANSDLPNRNGPLVLVRPRSLNLDENHVLVDGSSTSGSLFDLAIWCTTWFHRKSRKTNKQTGRPTDYCYFYIPKIENHKEARWWNEVFTEIELFFRLPLGRLKAVVLIENFLASFEMDEILYEMRDHCLGLNAGKWDYIFSFIKKLRTHHQFVLSARKYLTMDLTFLNTYERLLIATCRKRGCLVTGGMAPYISTGVPQDDNLIFNKIVQEKERGALLGYNGELVADPLFTKCVMIAYKSKALPPKFLPEDENEIANMLISVPENPIISGEAVKHQLYCLIKYIQGWLNGEGYCIVNNCLEDLATTEISRSLVWQWITHKCQTSNGVAIDVAYVSNLIDQIKLEHIDFQTDGGEIVCNLARNLFNTNFVGFLPDLIYPLIVNLRSIKSSL